MSLIPVLINAGSLLTPVLLSSSLALSFVNGVSEDARVHPWMSVERGQKGPKRAKKRKISPLFLMSQRSASIDNVSYHGP